MSHIAREKNKLLNRVRRIRGQVEAVERALEGESSCEQVLQLLTAARGAMNGLMAEVIEDHIREHVAAPGHDDVSPLLAMMTCRGLKLQMNWSTLFVPI